MLKQTEFDVIEPLLRVRQLLTVAESLFLDRLVGCIRAIPADQPHCASVISMLTSCFLQYAKQLGSVKAPFAELMRHAEAVLRAVNEHRASIEGKPPQAQLAGRYMSFPVWTLATKLTAAHRPLCIALGAEVACALVTRQSISDSYSTKLRRDIDVFGRLPTNAEMAQPEDLESLGFGSKWVGSYRRTDRMVKRIVCNNPPPAPDSTDPLSTAELIRRLSYRFTYPDLTRRKAVQHDGCLQPEAIQRVAQATRTRVEAEDPAALVEAACMLTGFSSEAALSIPLVAAQSEVVGVGLARDGKCFFLNLDAIFPSRHRPDPSVAHLFERTASVAPLYCPAFFAHEVARRALAAPQSSRLGDLVNWHGVNHRTALLEEDESKLYSSLARCQKSMAALSLMLGEDRLATALQTWDFCIIPSARAYYSRLSGEEQLDCAERLFGFLGWLPLAHSEAHPPIGSRTVLTHSAVAEIFEQLAASCKQLWPGRRAELDRLLAHHRAYAQYSGALLTFCLGAREVAAYDFLANELCLGQTQVVLRDKGRSDETRALPVPLTDVAREQIRQWRAHCAALALRLDKHRDVRAMKLCLHLREVAHCAPVPLLVDLAGAEPVALGSVHIWGCLPAALRVPANVGRHFWQNVLRDRGHGSRDIDRFMRHSVVALDPNDSDHDSVASDAFARIAATQQRVLEKLGVGPIPGLRRA